MFPRFPQLPDRIVKIIFRTNGRIQIQQSNTQYPGDEQQLEIGDVDHLGFDSSDGHSALVEAGALQRFRKPVL
jgi:hypothetical protein